MSRAGNISGSLVKSAMLWLTIGVMLASIYGALLASRGERPNIFIAPFEPAPILTASTDFSAPDANR